MPSLAGFRNCPWLNVLLERFWRLRKLFFFAASREGSKIFGSLSALPELYIGNFDNITDYFPNDFEMSETPPKKKRKVAVSSSKAREWNEKGKNKKSC